MAYHEVTFPEQISYGSSGGPGFNTKIVETDGGSEFRIARFTQPRRRYDVSESVKKEADLAELLGFYLARGGAANGFRFKDWGDYSTGPSNVGTPTPTDMLIGPADGTAVQFELEKRYVSGPITHVRRILKPVAGTVRLALSGVEVTEGWTLDDTTGRVLFTTPPTGELTWGGEFEVPVRFEETADQLFAASIDDFKTGSMTVPLVEIRDADAVTYEDFFMGGSMKHVMQNDVLLSLGRGRVHILQPESSGLRVILPGLSTIASGGPVFYLMNDGPNIVDVDNADSVNLLSLAAGQGVTLLVGVSLSGAKLWRAF